METKKLWGLAAALGIALAAAAVTPAHAEKHDSNTLHKLGNAVQYPVRKAGENLSVDVHRAEGRKSHVSDRPHDRKVLITADGDKIPLHSDRYYGHRKYSHYRHWSHRGSYHHGYSHPAHGTPKHSHID